MSIDFTPRPTARSNGWHKQDDIVLSLWVISCPRKKEQHLVLPDSCSAAEVELFSADLSDWINHLLRSEGFKDVPFTVGAEFRKGRLINIYLAFSSKQPLWKPSHKRLKAVLCVADHLRCIENEACKNSP